MFSNYKVSCHCNLYSYLLNLNNSNTDNIQMIYTHVNWNMYEIFSLYIHMTCDVIPKLTIIISISLNLLNLSQYFEKRKDKVSYTNCAAPFQIVSVIPPANMKARNRLQNYRNYQLNKWHINVFLIKWIY